MNPSFRLIFIPTIITLGSIGCGLSTDSQKSYVNECVIPSDQTGTFNGHWTATPVPIAFHQGDFTANEMDQIITAADTWNDFYGATKGYNTIDYGDRSNPRTSAVSTKDASCATLSVSSDNQFTAPIVIYKVTSWPNSYPSSAIAITRFCTGSSISNGLKNFTYQWLDINYQLFFSSGKKLPDLQSIVLHEMGHILGLNHSCESDGGTGIPSCGSGTLNSDYKAALMYPVFGFDTSGFGEIKRSLLTNDQQRANCLYDAK